MTRFFVDMPLEVNQQTTLPDTVFHHWIRVLRAQTGEQATLFNGQGGEYRATLQDIQKKTATVYIDQFNPVNRAPTYQVTLGQVMSKGDRMDYAIQKATELGVHAIQLLVSERCEMRLKYERDQKKIEHWQQVAIAACEQCGMNIVPKILAPLTLEDWLLQPCSSDTKKLVLAPAQQAIRFGMPFPSFFYLLVGPEGGLSDAEIELANAHGFQNWTLGERILRTETAPVAALSALLFAESCYPA
ncbi:16S rRNA (uracil(1498)-N(3))-methyltransferase [Alkanindiges sp. WGS2144]|uniref:16S rRNA (uracil(1498)-N(3))-methyltransferase n=1 Tax=Alkanindiges sp. WGS2144 TaxID=3366808 RepID=UPI003752A695